MARRAMLMLLAVALLGCSGCSEGGEYCATIDFENRQWKSDQSAVFEFLSRRNSTTSDLSVFVRSDRQAKNRSLRLVVKTVDPDGLYWLDTVGVLLPDNNLSTHNAQRLVRSNIRWPKAGKYSVSVSPVEDIEGVISAGVCVTNVNQLNNQ